MSFFYYAPTSSLVAVPIASTDAPFIFNEVTSDFQEISIQGQANYRITDPKRVSQLLNFTLDASARGYVSDDPQKLSARVINVIKVLTRKELQTLSLRDALRASDALVREVTKGLAASTEISSLGLEVVGLSILAIKPNAETGRALEAEAREHLLREADEAIYARFAKRNSTPRSPSKTKSARYAKPRWMPSAPCRRNTSFAMRGWKPILRSRKRTGSAVNDLFVGVRSHIWAGYTISVGKKSEQHSSSGLIVSTGLGSTGWFRSLMTGAARVASEAAGGSVKIEPPGGSPGTRIIFTTPCASRSQARLPRRRWCLEKLPSSVP